MAVAPAPSTAFVERFRRHLASLKAQGISQAAFAKKHGFSTNTVSAWKNGTYAPDFDNAAILAQAMGTTVDELMGTAVGPPPGPVSARPPDDDEPPSEAEALVLQLADLGVRDALFRLLAARAEIDAATARAPDLLDALQRAQQLAEQLRDRYS